MAKKKKDEETVGSSEGGQSAAATKPKRAKKPAAKPKPPQMLPPWKVLLHNDDKNSFDHVIGTIVELTPLKKEDAVLRTLEAHETGVALLLTTHKERAELYKEQFESKSLVVTIEPAEK
ncbi:MAG TPA: ATP-dependent Clp protease adaptor ClpS [Tepidisphaeraceae bacterium]|jgi:ATP-dependent Clp protease adapter protein ClpS